MFLQLMWVVQTFRPLLPPQMPSLAGSGPDLNPGLPCGWQEWRLEPSCWPVGAVQQQGAWVGSQSSLPSRASHTCLNCSAEGQLCLTEPSPQGLSQELHLELHTGVLQKVIGKQNSCKGKFLLVQKCLKSTRGSYRCSVCFVAYIIRELFEDVFQAWDSKTIFFKETLSFHYNFA